MAVATRFSRFRQLNIDPARVKSEVQKSIFGAKITVTSTGSNRNPPNKFVANHNEILDS